MTKARPGEGDAPFSSTIAEGVSSTIADSTSKTSGVSSTIAEPASPSGVLRPASVSRASGVGGVADLPTVEPGHFAIKREIARGGLGAVLEARDKVLGRTVAIKRGLYDNPAASARFIREALVTARLQHPSIVPVYEAGRWPGGEPFYAMKLVSGRPLSSVIASAKSLDERLALLPNVIAVADAMAYAHGQRIIHRDLKPDNVLVGEFGETVVIDWGLAKDLEIGEEPDVEVDTLSLNPYAAVAQGLTVAGAIMGTPAYMAPEQAKGEVVDERTDVYAIGALIYHALSGEAPFGGETKDEVLERVKQGTPKPLDQRIPRDLATIMRKAMAASPADRYATAKELAEDLRRFQTGQLVSARGYTRWQLLARWARRHRTTLAISSLALVALVIVGAIAIANVVKERNVATSERNRATRQESLAQQARVTAELRNNELILVQAQSKVERDPTTALAWLKLYPQTAPNWQAAHEIVIDAQERGPARHVLLHRQARMLAMTHDGAVLLSAANDSEIRCWDTLAGKSLRAIVSPARVRTIAVSPVARTAAFATFQGGVYLAALPGGAPKLLVQHAGDVHAIAFSSDGTQVASVGSKGQVFVVDVATGAARTLTGHDGHVGDVAFSPSGALLATAGDDRTIRLWDLARGSSKVLRGHEDFVAAVTFAPDERSLASASEDRTARTWSLDGTLQRTLRHEAPVVGVELTADGALITRAGNRVTIWRASGERQLVSSGIVLYDWALSADRRKLALAGTDGSLVHELQTGKTQTLPMDAVSHAVVLSNDGRRLVTLGTDSLIRIWEQPPQFSRPLRGHDGVVVGVALSPDGKRAITASEDRTVRVWELDQPGGGRILTTHGNSVRDLAMSSDGAWLATSAWGTSLRLTQIATGATRELEHGNELAYHEITNDNRAVITLTRDGTLRHWDIASGTGRVIASGEVGVVDASPDGARVAVGRRDGGVAIVDVATGARRSLGSHVGPVGGVALLPDGKHVLSRGGIDKASDLAVRSWNLETGASRTLLQARTPLHSHAVSPDGAWLAIGGLEQLFLIELASGTARPLPGIGALVVTNELVFSPDSTLLAVASTDSTVRLWNVATGASQIAHRHGGKIETIAFSLDGKRLASASHDLTAWVGEIVVARSLPATPAVLARTLSDFTSVVIDDDNRAISPN